jgi:hypothetical protein
MVRYELHQPIASSPVCGGTHRLFGITWVYHLHRAKGGQKVGAWKEAADTIADYIKRAQKYQNPDGSFSTSYLQGKGNVPDSQLRLATTGHILEWLALALTDKELHQEWVERAADELTLMILRNVNEPLDGGALYHAAHGLHLYRARRRRIEKKTRRPGDKESAKGGLLLLVSPSSSLLIFRRVFRSPCLPVSLSSCLRLGRPLT